MSINTTACLNAMVARKDTKKFHILEEPTFLSCSFWHLRLSTKKITIHASAPLRFLDLESLPFLGATSFPAGFVVFASSRFFDLRGFLDFAFSEAFVDPGEVLPLKFLGFKKLGNEHSRIQ